MSKKLEKKAQKHTALISKYDKLVDNFNDIQDELDEKDVYIAGIEADVNNAQGEVDEMKARNMQYEVKMEYYCDELNKVRNVIKY